MVKNLCVSSLAKAFILIFGSGFFMTNCCEGYPYMKEWEE